MAVTNKNQVHFCQGKCPKSSAVIKLVFLKLLEASN